MDRREADELIERYIEPDPSKGSKAEARLRDSKVAVWALAGYLQDGESDLARAATDYHLPREAVEAAREYYRRHKGVIDDRVAANDVR
jgi:uncharacterized protein (DUF433 family)